MAYIEGNVLAKFILDLATEEEQRFMNEWLKEGQNRNTYNYMCSLLGQQKSALA